MCKFCANKTFLEDDFEGLHLLESAFEPFPPCSKFGYGVNLIKDERGVSLAIWDAQNGETESTRIRYCPFCGKEFG